MTLEEIENILIEFKNLDLSIYPQSQIEEIFKKIRKMPIHETTFHAGMVIYRARTKDNGETYCKRKDLSYKPREFNNKYQRASKPNRTMFYGAVIPTENLQYELDSEQVIAASEASYLLRNPDLYKTGEQKLVFGKWRIIGDCKLATVLYSDYKKNISPYSKNCSERLFEWLKSEHPDYFEHAKLLTDFFAEEYAKVGINEEEDYKYMISANFSESVVHLGINGVIFPSVRIESKGLNVAIDPNFVDNFMRLESVCECTIYKNKNKIIINNDKLGYTKPEDQSFELKEIEIGEYRTSDEEIKKMLLK